MPVKIFEIENAKVVISPNCLLIPEFKAVVEKYEDPIAALSFIYFRYALDSPYQDVPEGDKDEVISKDVGGDFSFDDEEMIAAGKKAEQLWTTPTRRFFINAKKGLETMGQYLGTQGIKVGVRDGNDATFLSMLKSVGSINKQFKELEKIADEEADGLARGGKDISYDE